MLYVAHNISYWINFGTLIGAVRHQGIIPWDNDADVSMTDSEAQKFLKLKPLLTQLGYQVNKRCFGYMILSQNAHLDIFLMKKRDGQYIFARRRPRNTFTGHDGKKVHFTEDELFPLKEYAFGSFMVWGPNKPHRFLDHLYKDWSTTAKFRVSTNTYASNVLILTDKEKVPAEPLGPLQDRVKELLSDKSIEE